MAAAVRLRMSRLYCYELLHGPFLLCSSSFASQSALCECTFVPPCTDDHAWHHESDEEWLEHSLIFQIHADLLVSCDTSMQGHPSRYIFMSRSDAALELSFFDDKFGVCLQTTRNVKRECYGMSEIYVDLSDSARIFCSKVFVISISHAYRVFADCILCVVGGKYVQSNMCSRCTACVVCICHRVLSHVRNLFAQTRTAHV